MRMWNVDPKMLCSQHLLGEHFDIHKFVGAMNKGMDLTAFVRKGFIEIHNLRKRHEELVKEMLERGYKHNSPLPKFSVYVVGHVDVKESFKKLSKCEKCKISESRRKS